MNFARNYEKKVHETLEAWSMRRSSHRPSNPAYYIEDCRISASFKCLQYILGMYNFGYDVAF